MVGGDEIEKLRLRKQALVLESTLNRLTLEAEWQNVQAATAWLGSAGQTFRQARPWLLLLAPLAGLLAGRSSAHRPGLLSRVLSALKWVRPLLGVWDSFSGRPSESQPRPSAKS